MSDPTEAERLHQRGNERLAAGDRSGAEAGYRAALAIDPNRTSSLNNLANLLREAGDPRAASDLYERAYALGGRSAALLSNAAKAALELDRFDVAIRFSREAIALHSDREAGHLVLAKTLARQGHAEQARGTLESAAAALPSSGAVHNALGIARDEGGDLLGAVGAFERAAELLPQNVWVVANLGDALRRARRFDRALVVLTRAVELDPMFAAAFKSLAALQFSLGECDAMASTAARAAALSSGLNKHSNLSMRLFGLAHIDSIEPEALREEHVRWGEGIAAEVGGAAVVPKTLRREEARTPGGSTRRRRVIYVSPDFRDHVVTRFLKPVLAEHDTSQFEIILASTAQVRDEVSAELAALHRWVDLGRMSREQARSSLEALEPHVIVDLAGHSGDSILALLVPRIAALQLTWLGSPCTTGLATIDGRITDALADPPGTEVDFTERLERLDRQPWVYLPDGLPEVLARPNGPPTFACFNRAAKLTASTLGLFAKVLEAVPDARLWLRTRVDGSSVMQSRVLAPFEALGVAERVSFLGEAPTFDAALETYGAVDVALDTFPYQGTTTTCDALSMGVPVVSLVGRWPASRVSKSLLSAVGLESLAVDDEALFVQTARDLVLNRALLSELRGSLRDRLRRGPLGDARGLARRLEAVYST